MMAVCFAGREPLLGAMWFVYVLFMALCILSLVSWGIRKVIKDEKKYEYVRFVVLLVGSVFSCLLTKLYGFTIPRVNNTITAVWLIYIGMMLVKRCNLKFNNVYVAVISSVIVYQAATVFGGINFAANEYIDIVTLTINSCACLYLICFISKKIEKCFVGGVVAKIGKDSFYIMALHFIGFKMLSLVLMTLGYERSLAELCPTVGHNILLLLGYMCAGVAFPLLVIFIFRRLKDGFIHCYRVSFHRGN